MQHKAHKLQQYSSSNVATSSRTITFPQQPNLPKSPDVQSISLGQSLRQQCP